MAAVTSIIFKKGLKKEKTKMSKTNAGQFLCSMRIRRGYDSISEYLRNYTDLPISESYYRDIETGRKIIKIDTAETLCKALKLNRKEFYYHFLKDVLPLDVSEELLKPVSSSAFKTVSEEFNKINQKSSVFRKAYEKKLSEEPYIVDEEIVRYLDNNFELLPLIHFIYMKGKCNFEELQEIAEKNNITKPLAQIIDEFKRHNIAIINEEKKTMTRYSKIFRIPRTDFGIKFKERFLKSEIEEAMQAANKERKISPNNSFIYSAITCIKSGKSLARVSERLTELLAEIEVEESNLDEERTVPYFVSIIFSSREKYTTENK